MSGQERLELSAICEEGEAGSVRPHKLQLIHSHQEPGPADGLSPMKVRHVQGSATTKNRASSSTVAAGFAHALQTAPPVEDLAPTRMQSLQQVQDARMRRAKKVPFQIPEGRQMSRNVQARVEARRKSAAYAQAQTWRAGSKTAGREGGGVLGCDSIFDPGDAGTGSRSASTSAALQRRKQQ